MAFCDFVIRYDPDKTTPEELTKAILYSIIIKRLKAHKPTVCFIGGDSGEGKSFASLRLQELLLEMQGLKLKDFLNTINVYTPIEYPQKLEKLLFDKKYKKANIICMHEAREIVKAKLWHSFLTQSIGDVNAMSRSIKRLCIFIISQFIRDITNDIRYTLTYYMIVRRPKSKKARLYINVMWKDDRDLEKPKLRKRKLSGYLVYPDGKYRRYIPQYLEMNKPSKEIIKLFEQSDFDAKAKIIRKKLDRLIKEMSLEIEDESKRVDILTEYYSKNPENIAMIGKRYRGKWKVKKEMREMLDLNDFEIKDFEEKLNEAIKEKGLIEEAQDV